MRQATQTKLDPTEFSVLCTAMPPVDLRPSQTEVMAIKQQLKLLGHTLPTDVIVEFLQENSGLLTAYQHPDLSVQQSNDHVDDYQPAGTTQRGHLAGAEPGFASRVLRPATQTIPELDVTWASAAPARHLRLGRPAQVPSLMHCFSAPVASPCYSLLEQCHACAVLQGMASSGQASYDDSFTVASSEALQASTVHRDVYDQRLCSRDRM